MKRKCCDRSNGGSEPRAAIAISRCVRSQHENRRDRIIFSAAVRREERPFVRDAARLKAAIYRLRTLPSLVYCTSLTQHRFALAASISPHCSSSRQCVLICVEN
jgi:hypothetical protein